MSHITCHECGSNEHVTSYGFGAGILGGYTVCAGDDCCAILELEPDTDGMPDDLVAEAKNCHVEWVEKTNAKRAAKGLPLLATTGRVEVSP